MMVKRAKFCGSPAALAAGLVCTLLCGVGCAPQVSSAQLDALQSTVDALQNRLARQDERLEAVSHDLLLLDDRLQRVLVEVKREPSHRALAVVRVAPTPVVEPPPEPEEPPIEIRMHGSAGPAPLAVTPVPPVPAAAHADSTASNPVAEQLFRAGLGAYQSGDGATAFAMFERFVRTYPRHPQADNAAYWMGECRYEEGDYAAALKEYARLVNDYPSSGKVPDAMLKMGICHQRLGNVGSARRVFEGVIAGYPRSATAELAQARLARVTRE